MLLLLSRNTESMTKTGGPTMTEKKPTKPQHALMADAYPSIDRAQERESVLAREIFETLREWGFENLAETLTFANEKYPNGITTKEAIAEHPELKAWPTLATEIDAVADAFATLRCRLWEIAHALTARERKKAA
jgi:hypothetical protein